LQQSRHSRCVIDRQKRGEDPMFPDPTDAKKYPNPMQNNAASGGAGGGLRPRIIGGIASNEL